MYARWLIGILLLLAWIFGVTGILAIIGLIVAASFVIAACNAAWLSVPHCAYPADATP